MGKKGSGLILLLRIINLKIRDLWTGRFRCGPFSDAFFIVNKEKEKEENLRHRVLLSSCGLYTEASLLFGI